MHDARGWIGVRRSWIASVLEADPSRAEGHAASLVWLYLYSSAVWEPCTIDGVDLKRGQLIASQRELAALTRKPRTSVRRLLGRFATEGVDGMFLREVKLPDRRDNDTKVFEIVDYDRWAGVRPRRADSPASGPQPGRVNGPQSDRADGPPIDDAKPDAPEVSTDAERATGPPDGPATDTPNGPADGRATGPYINKVKPPDNHRRQAGGQASAAWLDRVEDAWGPELGQGERDLVAHWQHDQCVDLDWLCELIRRRRSSAIGTLGYFRVVVDDLWPRAKARRERPGPELVAKRPPLPDIEPADWPALRDALRQVDESGFRQMVANPAVAFERRGALVLSVPTEHHVFCIARDEWIGEACRIADLDIDIEVETYRQTRCAAAEEASA